MSPSRQEKKHWTIDDIDLDRIDRERVRQDEDLFYLVACASFVESGSDLYTQNLVQYYAGDAEVETWLREQWEQEELQHGAALRAYVEHVWPEFDWQRAYQGFLDEYSQYCKVELLEPTRAQELAARCVVETGTSTYYRALARATDEPVLKHLAGLIATDEVNHYKHFYQYFRRYRQQEKIGRSRVLSTLSRRTLELKSEDADCAIRHVALVYKPELAADPVRLKELASRMSRTVRVNLKPETTIKMIMRPLELPVMLQNMIEFPLRQFMQRVLLR
ncbi:ferritin [Herbaspirillum rubrisubalbicans]|jgi:rubrerythrin|uniref:Ferritin n=2 Tax=Herbaspirillum rubrisubalbicans TaxID=80842 RepID=A0ABX9BW76_9BURK|nr:MULTISPECIES: ferritin-like domain-containing protein [Herbaspirillum]NQE49905.1 ferritin [Herbaspirillum rubrisubalbicans]QJQ03733.1 ferritin [Herbaspirillum rubrisubalbicans Os34]RAM62034.1 ferritin [Herbaspirillum rubrisubalbicans]RAN43241.1 ferritin [Herbaspirillum rubrisubalbicans]